MESPKEYDDDDVDDNDDNDDDESPKEDDDDDELFYERPMELCDLIDEGDKDAVLRYMERHKMTPKYFIDYIQILEKNLEETGEWADPYDPVTEAAKHGHLYIMNTLIERGFDPDNKGFAAVCDDNWGPLQWACVNGHLHIVKSLIEDHNVNVKMYEDELISIAAERNHIDIVKYLVRSGTTVNDLMLHKWGSGCGPEMIQFILSRGVDVNARDVDQTTPLFHTACSANALVVLDAGADVDAKDKDGNTTFLRAAQEQDLDLMRLLISRGADPNVVNNDGNTALHFALDGMITVNYLKAIKYLVVELGLDCLNTRNSRGFTPVAKAIQSSCEIPVIELLVNYGFNITDEFDMLDDDQKKSLEFYIPNCIEYFRHLKQRTPQPRSLRDLASLKLRRHFGVHLESAVKVLPLPEHLKDLVRIQNMDYHDCVISGFRQNMDGDDGDDDDGDDDDGDDDDDYDGGNEEDDDNDVNDNYDDEDD